MTPLMDHSMIIDTLKPLKFFRELGIPVRSAMNTDVNGLPWGVVDALLDHGITGISMAINEHFGHALRPWPRAFRWQAPGGRTITAYNGFIYGVTSDRNMRVPVRHGRSARTRAAVDQAVGGQGLPASLPDDADHQHPLPRQRLAAGGAAGFRPPLERDKPATISLRFGTLSEFFDRMRKEPDEHLPMMRGDWTDWWNFGAAAPRTRPRRRCRASATSMTRSGWTPGITTRSPRQRALCCTTARRSLALFCEHTWGADRSISQPYSPETRTQQLLKLGYAADGASLARMLRRDGLERLAIAAGGEEPTAARLQPASVSGSAVAAPALSAAAWRRA